MFYYLSFLRPPPSQVAPAGFISITPQVANDLRTDLCADSQEMFYAWSYSLPPSDQNNAPSTITKPQKLTIWRQSGAYKEISVPHPPGVREGQSCRLILTAHAQGNSHVVNLASPMLGERPFSVMSMPILFSARSAKGKAAGKQEQVERVYRILLSSQDQVFMTVKEQTSFDLDKKVWDSGIGLSSWIIGMANGEDPGGASPIVHDLADALLSPKTRHIIELGAGTGIVSLTLGALRSANEPSGEGCIITTDLASAMPLLVHNITANENLFKSASARPQAIVLDWDDEHFPEEVSAIRNGLDVIIMADVTYNTSSFPSLIRTLSGLIRLGASAVCSGAKPRSPLILLGYKERDPEERSLWDMVREIGIDFKKVGERCGAGGDPVEVWIGVVQ